MTRPIAAARRPLDTGPRRAPSTATAAAALALAAGFAAPAAAQDRELAFVGSWSGLDLHRNFEQPFWGGEVTRLTDGALAAEVTTFDQMGIEGGAVFRLLSQGLFDVGATVADYCGGGRAGTRRPGPAVDRDHGRRGAGGGGGLCPAARRGPGRAVRRPAAGDRALSGAGGVLQCADRGPGRPGRADDPGQRAQHGGVRGCAGRDRRDPGVQRGAGRAAAWRGRLRGDRLPLRLQFRMARSIDASPAPADRRLGSGGDGDPRPTPGTRWARTVSRRSWRRSRPASPTRPGPRRLARPSRASHA